MFSRRKCTMYVLLGTLLLFTAGCTKKIDRPAKCTDPFPGIERVIQAARNRNVMVETASSWGSGIIIKTGVVLTNQHELNEDFGNRVNGKEVTAVKKSLPEDDLAVLYVETDRMPLISINERRRPEDFEVVFAVGNSFHIQHGIFFGTVITVGEKYIYTSTKVLDGMSGAGFYNSTGELIGIQVGGMGSRTDGDYVAIGIPPKKIAAFLKSAGVM